ATRQQHTLPAFPTRRSSDLEPGAEDLDAAKWKPSINIVGITLYEEPRVHQYEGKTGEIWRVSLPTNKEDVHSAYVIDSKKTITRSEEHTSELQSREKLVCRL